MVKKWVNDTGEYQDGKRIGETIEYRQWGCMLRRCRVGGYDQVKFPTYIGCTHYPEWESYDLWLEWAGQQVGFLNKDEKGNPWQIDKDILFKGNKYYSPETCVFVPPEVNAFLLTRKSCRGELPVGVYFKKSHQLFIAQISTGLNQKKHLGLFTTPTEAFAAYKVAKESYAKVLAIKYTGLVDPRVIDALNNFTVNIDD